jgi:hypothetical protein
MLKLTCSEEVAVKSFTGMATNPKEMVAEDRARAGMELWYRRALVVTKSSADGLESYREKRDPSRTNEPFAAERISRSLETWQGDFVVHQHGARRMHFDLRIEMGGSVARFAVHAAPVWSLQVRVAVRSRCARGARCGFCV